MAKSISPLVMLAVLLLCLRIQQKYSTVTDLGTLVPSVPVEVPVRLALPLLNARAAGRSHTLCPPFSSRRPKSSIVFLLLLVAGDIESNPGPTDTNSGSSRFKF